MFCQTPPVHLIHAHAHALALALAIFTTRLDLHCTQLLSLGFCLAFVGAHDFLTGLVGFPCHQAHVDTHGTVCICLHGLQT